MNASHAVGIAASVLVGVLSAPASADPIKELELYKSALGKWNCDAKEVESGKAFKAVAEFSADFDGNTYIERYWEIANADHPNAWKAIFIMSYDSTSKRWVRNGVDNSGERNAASSSGWNKNTWVWENDGVNIVIDRQSENARTFAVDVKQSAGVKRVVTAACTRT